MSRIRIGSSGNRVIGDVLSSSSYNVGVGRSRSHKVIVSLEMYCQVHRICRSLTLTFSYGDTSVILSTASHVLGCVST